MSHKNITVSTSYNEDIIQMLHKTKHESDKP